MRRTRWAVAATILWYGTFSGGLAVTRTTAQVGDVKVVMQAESAGQPAMNMELYLGEDRLRMDMSSDMSIISISGDSPRMYMVQHPDRQYMEWGPQQLQMMQQMQSGAEGQANSDVNPSKIEFTETGQTAQIGPWNAFEVEMSDANGDQGSLWLTTDTEIGLFEVMVRAIDGASLLSSPMAGGSGASINFQKFQAVADAQGLPDGRVIRVVSEASNGTTTITLSSVEAGPLPADTFAPPADYSQMEMPSIPGFPG